MSITGIGKQPITLPSCARKPGENEMKVIVDGVEQSEKTILLVDDGREHKVDVRGC